MAVDRVADDGKRAYQILAVKSARVDPSAQTGCYRQTALAHRARLRRTQTGTWPGTFRGGTGAVFIIMQPCRLQPMASWYWNGAFFPLRQLAATPREPISRFTYPVCNPTTRPEALPVRTERHNPQSVATLRRQIAAHLARSLPRCPCCLRGFL